MNVFSTIEQVTHLIDDEVYKSTKILNTIYLEYEDYK